MTITPSTLLRYLVRDFHRPRCGKRELLYLQTVGENKNKKEKNNSKTQTPTFLIPQSLLLQAGKAFRFP
ncbi:unnamed protein product, partial [Bubo scandiacus]